MNVFFDTNALFKLYYTEVGTSAIGNFIRRHSSNLDIIIADITLIEVRSALYRRLRMSECTFGVAEQVWEAIDHDAAFMRICETDANVQQQAKELIHRHGLINSLRTLDSLQIASALVCNRTTPIDVVLSADTTFLNVMRQYLTALNPVTDVLP